MCQPELVVIGRRQQVAEIHFAGLRAPVAKSGHLAIRKKLGPHPRLLRALAGKQKRDFQERRPSSAVLAPPAELLRRLDDFAAGVEATAGTHRVRPLGLLAVGAGLNLNQRQREVGSPPTLPRLGLFDLW